MSYSEAVTHALWRMREDAAIRSQAGHMAWAWPLLLFVAWCLL